MILLLLRRAKGLVPLRASFFFNVLCLCCVVGKCADSQKREWEERREKRKRRKCPSHAPFPRAPPALLMPAAAVVVGAAVVVFVAGVAGSQKEEGKEAIKDSPFSDFF